MRPRRSSVDVRSGQARISDMLAAGTHAPLRSNDAIHLATAIRLAVDELVTYRTAEAQCERNAIGVR